MLQVKQAIGFQTSKVVGCIIGHSHQDHASRIEEYQRNAIQCFSTDEVQADIKERWNGERTEPFKINGKGQPVLQLGGFFIQAFDLIHDVPCNGFLIRHKEFGKLLYISDTEYVPQDFSKLGCNHLMIECNHDARILSESYIKSLRDRVLSSHMELETTKKAVRNIDNSELYNTVLIHLSSSTSDSDRFQKEIQELTYSNVFVAEQGLEIELKNSPF